MSCEISAQLIQNSLSARLVRGGVGVNATDYTGSPKMRTASNTALAAVFFGLCLTLACGRGPANSFTNNSRLKEDEKHRLYAAALASSDSPLDTRNFRLACQRIGIFDTGGQPNDRYMTFVGERMDWSAHTQTEEFRQQINTREKAQAYVQQHLP